MRLSHSVVMTYFDDMYFIVSKSLPPSIAFHSNWFLTELMWIGECSLHYKSLVHGHHVFMMRLLNSMCLLGVGSLHYGMLFSYSRYTT